jgi:ankyrin repeat protein
LQTLTESPDFGGTHPLHQAVYRRDVRLVKEWVQKLGPKIDTISNFLGQTPMHGALAPESLNILNLLLGHAPALVNKADNWGLTPLMYAVALGYNQAASLLIKKGANLKPRSHWEDLDFIGCAFQWDQELLLWVLLPDIETRTKWLDDYPYVWARLAEQTSGVADWLSMPRKEKWITKFWENCLSKPYLDSRLDMVFGESGSTLGHLARTPEIAQRLLDAGFRRYNHRNASGEHCLFPAVKTLNGPLVSSLLAAGTSVDIQDNKGKTCLHKLLKKHIGRVTNPEMHRAVATFAIVRLLLDATSQPPLASITDDCRCPCSENGHLASDQLSAEFQDCISLDGTSPLWVVEYVCMLEEVGRAEEARTSILGQLRLWRFSKLGIPHYRTCCCFGRKEEEDRPWDIMEDERKVEKLEAEMEELRQLPLDGLKARLALRMRESYDALKVTRATEAEEKEERRRARRARQSGCRPLVGSHSVDSRFMVNSLVCLPLTLLGYIRNLITGCGSRKRTCSSLQAILEGHQRANHVSLAGTSLTQRSG